MIDVTLRTKKITGSHDKAEYEIKGRCILMGDVEELTQEIKSLLEGLQGHPIGKIALANAIEELIEEAKKDEI